LYSNLDYDLGLLYQSVGANIAEGRRKKEEGRRKK
jgi:hypothetical protein